VLQRLAGNRAVSGLLAGVHGVITLQRKGGTPAAEMVRTAEQNAQLVADIITVIQQLEVGGGAVTESSYDTSAGTKASYASKMQATVPWTLDLLKRHKELRTKFSITMDELKSAQQYVDDVSALWKAVRALPGGSTLEQAKKSAVVTTKLTAAGLDDDDLQRMLTFGNWRSQVISGLETRATAITALHDLSAEELAAEATAAELAAALKPADKRALTEWRKAKKKGKPPAATAADLTAKERTGLETVVGTRQVVGPLRQAGVDTGIGIGAGSAKRYVAQELAHQDKKGISAHWGEDLAAWRRYAIEKSIPEIGEKLKQASVDDEGMTLGHVSIADAVATIPKKHTTWTDSQVAWEAFKQQNGNKGYADEALQLFERTHTVPAVAAPTTAM
jgi:hypothetical protein